MTKREALKAALDGKVIWHPGSSDSVDNPVVIRYFSGGFVEFRRKSPLETVNSERLRSLISDGWAIYKEPAVKYRWVVAHRSIYKEDLVFLTREKYADEDELREDIEDYVWAEKVTHTAEEVVE